MTDIASGRVSYLLFERLFYWAILGYMHAWNISFVWYCCIGCVFAYMISCHFFSGVCANSSSLRCIVNCDWVLCRQHIELLLALMMCCGYISLLCTQWCCLLCIWTLCLEDSPCHRSLRDIVCTTNLLTAAMLDLASSFMVVQWKRQRLTFHEMEARVGGRRWWLAVVRWEW
jgi:hypothetical protein